MKRDVLDFIDEQRAHGKSWPEIAQAIRDLTDGEVAVSRQAIQQWQRRPVQQQGEDAA